MGGSQAVVNLDSYHATGHWDDAPYFATQLDQDAFESAMAAVYIPEAVEGWTGNYEADGTTFMYVNQDAFNDIRWGHMQIGSVPEDCSPPPMTCALRSVDDKLCFIEVEKQIRQAMRLNKDCIVVIVPRNSDLRVVPPSGGAADKTPFECNGTQYEAWIVCGLSNPSPLGHRPVQRKRQNGMWEALPFVPLKYGGTFYAVDKNGNWMTPGRRAMYWGGMWAPLSSYGAEASRFELCDFAKLYNSAYCTKSGRWDWMD